MSIIARFKMLWLGLEMNFADIPWQKSNITGVAIENIKVLLRLHICYLISVKKQPPADD
jgi:hypothetical protein